MAEKIKIDNKPIDEGMKESGTKADALDTGPDAGAGPDLEFGSGSGADGSVEVMEMQVSGGSGPVSQTGPTSMQNQGAQQTTGQQSSAHDGGTDGGFDDSFGAGADGGLAVEHGVSIPPEGFDHLETVGQQTDGDSVDAASGAIGDGGVAPPDDVETDGGSIDVAGIRLGDGGVAPSDDVETDGGSVDAAGGMIGDGGVAPPDVQPQVDPVDADLA